MNELNAEGVWLVALAVALVVAAAGVWLVWLLSQASRKRIRHASMRANAALGIGSQSRWPSISEATPEMLNPWLVRLFGTSGGTIESHQQRLERAGLRGNGSERWFLLLRMCLTVAMAAFVGTLSGTSDALGEPAWIFLGCLAGMAAGYVIPSVWLDRRIAGRQTLIAAHFPDAVDMVRLCVEAGLGIESALTRVGREMDSICKPLSDEIHHLNLEIRAGLSRERALRKFASRVGLAEVDQVVAVLVQVERLGTSVAEALLVHTDVMRTRQRQTAEEKAAKVPVKLLFPMIFCIFPALFVVVLGPALLSVLRMSGSFNAGG